MERLIDMLEYTRKDGSEGEAQFIERFIMPYKPQVICDKGRDPQAYIVEVGEGSTYLFSAHTDTVHSKDAPVKQVVHYDPECGLFYKLDGMPLGADNAAGVWLLLSMIDANVPGVYIFHHGEECGGIGSKFMATNHVDFLKRFTHAIAFDRRGADSVITAQMCGDTASLTFAQAMSDLLNEGTDFVYSPDDTGTFTDTANYARLIPECTNISVGYYDEHTKNEHLDVWHLTKLKDKVVEIFSSGARLPAVRDPSARAASRWDFFPSAGGPQSADDFLAMHYRDLVKYVKKTKSDEIAEAIYALADEVEYWRDKALSGSGEDTYVFPLDEEVEQYNY